MNGRLIVTYLARGSEVTKYLEDFKDETSGLGEVRRIKLTIQEPEAHGINRVVIVDLDSLGRNEVKVQGVNETWVIGKTEAISRELRKHEKVFVTTYKRFGVSLNQWIFLAMLVLNPSIESLAPRALFVLIVALLLVLLVWLHGKYVPNFAVFFGEREPGVFQRAWPSVVSWLIAATASLAAAAAFYYLTTKQN